MDEPIGLKVVFVRNDQYAGNEAFWNGSTIIISEKTETKAPEIARSKIGDKRAFEKTCDA